MDAKIVIPDSILLEVGSRLGKIDEIHAMLKSQGMIKTPEHYTPKEFIRKAKIGRNKFEKIKPKLKMVRVSPRKFLIPHSELVRWLNGELY